MATSEPIASDNIKEPIEVDDNDYADEDDTHSLEHSILFRWGGVILIEL